MYDLPSVPGSCRRFCSRSLFAAPSREQLTQRPWRLINQPSDSKTISHRCVQPCIADALWSDREAVPLSGVAPPWSDLEATSQCVEQPWSGLAITAAACVGHGPAGIAGLQAARSLQALRSAL
jgi:hypothetical protein